MPLFRGRRLSFTSNSGSAKARSGSVHRVSPDHAMALRDPVMQTMRATLLQEEALRSGAGGKKQYEVPMPRTYDDFVRQASQKKVVAAPSFEETSRRRLGDARPPKVYAAASSSKVYVAVRVDDDGLLRALGVVASDQRPASKLSRRVERAALEEAVLEHAFKSELLRQNEEERDERRAARARLDPKERAVAESYAGARAIADSERRDRGKAAGYAAARDAFWGGDADETDYEEEVLQFRAKQAAKRRQAKRDADEDRRRRAEAEVRDRDREAAARARAAAEAREAARADAEDAARRDAAAKRDADHRARKERMAAAEADARKRRESEPRRVATPLPGRRPPPPRTPGATKGLDALAAATGPIKYDEVPWLDTGGGWASLGLSTESPNDAKRKAVRHALLRWHSDKFLAKFGTRVTQGGDGDRVAAKITETTRFLQGLLAEDKAR